MTPPFSPDPRSPLFSRRALLKSLSSGFGYLAFAGLAARAGAAANPADDLCLLRSMQTDLPAHPQAFLQLHTGSFQFVRPSLGAWTLYGLGTENENLPGFVTLTPPAASGGAQNYGSSFLPAIYQGTRLGADSRPIEGAEIRDLKSPLNTTVQRAELDLLQTLNRETLRLDRSNPDVEGVIESYELAFRMQKEMPQVMDLSGESEATKKLYGIADAPSGDGRGQGASAGSTDDF